jgi:hypothetical protein
LQISQLDPHPCSLLSVVSPGINTQLAVAGIDEIVVPIAAMIIVVASKSFFIFDSLSPPCGQL